MMQGVVGRLRAVAVAAAFISSHPHVAYSVSVTLPSPVPLQSESIDMLRATSAEDSDQWKIVAFGFTRCKDICPKTIGNVSWLVKLAAEKEIELDGVFVTVDPDRDTDTALARYTAPHGSRVSFLRLEDEALTRFKDEFGVEAVFYTKNQGNQVHYQVDHSSMAFLIDPAGRIRVVFDVIEDAGSVAEMLRQDRAFFE